MREQFKNLMHLLNQHQEGKQVNLAELLRTSTAFFNELKESFSQGDQEEKKEIMGMVNKMYAALLAQAKKIPQMTGMGETEISNYVQNPNNFSPEQWKMMQETKEQIAEASKEISSYLRQANAKKEGGPASPPLSGPQASKSRPPTRPKKDKWMKS